MVIQIDDENAVSPWDMPAKHDITVHEGRQPASRRLEEVAGLGFKKPGTHPTLLCLLTLTDSGGGGGGGGWSLGGGTQHIACWVGAKF